MTHSEKILASRSGRDFVRPGDIVEARPDAVMIHDNNAALTIQSFSKIIDASVWDPEKVSMFMDHHSPSTTVKAAGHHALMRSFAKEHGIRRIHDCGCGISHVVMFEDGLLSAGRLVLGTDSHTTGEGANGAFACGIGATEMASVLVKGSLWLRVPETIRIRGNGSLRPGVQPRDLVNAVLARLGPSGADYCAVEFCGPAFTGMDLDGRITACVMSAEMGAKNAMVLSPDDTATAPCKAEYVFDAGKAEPTVALPDLPTNVVPVRQIAGDKIRIHQAAIASCVGCLLSDLEIATRILRGRHAAPGVRLLIIPASREIYTKAAELGYIAELSRAGATIGAPACGSCGAHDAGILAPGEVCIAASTRNMKGRMGAGGIVYLAGSAVVAASAITGYITDPTEFLDERK